MNEGNFSSIGAAASTVAAGISSFLSPAVSPLSDPPTDGTINLPEDLYARADAQTEWWYYTGHCRTSSGREFGFEWVFFKRRTDLDQVAGVPLTFLGNPMYFAHFAISDITGQRFRYDHKRSFGGVMDEAVSASEKSCDVRMGDWSLREVAGKHIIHATLPDGCVFDAVITTDKPPVPNGDDGNGIARKGAGASKHFSFTRMNVEGRINDLGKSEEFTGTAWMDREFGSWGQGEWDWFSIQFDDKTELMIYQYRDVTGEMKGESTGTYVDAEGFCTYLRRSDFEIEHTGTWTSPHTKADYPAGWHVRVEKLSIDIDIMPLIPDQELDTRGTTMIVYWEGACRVSGTKGEGSGLGKAYVELVGYDKSHNSVGLADFLLGRRFADLRKMLG